MNNGHDLTHEHGLVQLSLSVWPPLSLLRCVFFRFLHQCTSTVLLLLNFRHPRTHFPRHHSLTSSPPSGHGPLCVAFADALSSQYCVPHTLSLYEVYYRFSLIFLLTSCFSMESGSSSNLLHRILYTSLNLIVFVCSSSPAMFAYEALRERRQAALRTMRALSASEKTA